MLVCNYCETPIRKTQDHRRKGCGSMLGGDISYTREAQPNFYQPPTKNETKSRQATKIFIGRDQRNTAIQVSRRKGVVTFVPLSYQGLEFITMSEGDFSKNYRPLQGFPIPKAAQLFLGVSSRIGATSEVLDFLASLVPAHSEVLSRAKSKFEAQKEKRRKLAKKRGKKKTKGRRKDEPTRKMTAASMIKDLIMEGKLSDAKIFEKAQNIFGLSDEKKYYVSSYRSMLKKAGMNPPRPKRS